MAAKYRKTYKTFWSDPQIQDMLMEKRRDEVLLLKYAINNSLSCIDESVTGIFEIGTGKFCQDLAFDVNEVKLILEYFNKERPQILEYDSKMHMIFIKNLYKHNYNYDPNIGLLMSAFEKTFRKAPYFWAEFGEKYRADLTKAIEMGIEKEEMQFLEKLFSLHQKLEDLPKPSLKISYFQKAQNDINNINKNKGK